MQATTLGLKNLERVAGMLLEATTTQPGEPYRELTEVYGRLVAQWTLEMNHVTALVGGFLSQQKHIGQEGVRFTPVPPARQAEAVRFLLTNAFITPMFLVKPELLRRMEPTGALNRVRNAQSSVMNSLLQPARLERLIEQAALDGTAAYAPLAVPDRPAPRHLGELATPARPIDPFRRNTQRVYLDTIDERLNGGAAPDRRSARCCAASCGRCAPSSCRRCQRSPIARSRLHLEDARDQIDEILDPRAMRARPQAGGRGGGAGAGDDGSIAGRGFDYSNDPFMRVPDTCWPDYVVP